MASDVSPSCASVSSSSGDGDRSCGVADFDLNKLVTGSKARIKNDLLPLVGFASMTVEIGN